MADTNVDVRTVGDHRDNLVGPCRLGKGVQVGRGVDRQTVERIDRLVQTLREGRDRGRGRAATGDTRDAGIADRAGDGRVDENTEVVRVLAIAVRLQGAHRSGDGQREAVLLRGIPFDRLGGCRELGIESTNNVGPRVLADRVGVCHIGNRLADARVNEDVHVPVLDILKLLIGEGHDGRDLLDVQRSAAELAAGDGLGAAFPDDLSGGGAVPDGERLTPRGRSASITGERQSARFLENSLGQKRTLRLREENAAGCIRQAGQRSIVRH